MGPMVSPPRPLYWALLVVESLEGLKEVPIRWRGGTIWVAAVASLGNSIIGSRLASYPDALFDPSMSGPG